MTTNPSNVFVDTNALLRATITSAPLHKEALNTIYNLWQDDVTCWISRQVIREYISVVTRPQPYASNLFTIDMVQQRVAMLRTLFGVADETDQVTTELVSLLAAYPTGGKQVHDANIVATMLAYNIDVLLTHNIDDFKRFSNAITLLPLTQP